MNLLVIFSLIKYFKQSIYFYFIGISSQLKNATGEKAFIECIYSHYETIQSDVFDIESRAGKLVNEIRLRKGLKQQIPSLDNYIDKL